MSASTIDQGSVPTVTDAVEAPVDQTVPESAIAPTGLALPTVGSALQKRLNRLTPELRSEALASNKSLRLMHETAGLYSVLASAGEKIEGGKTLASAYVWQAGVDAGETKGAIGELLALQTVTRIGYVAKLHFELGFTPSDPEWSDLTSKLVTNGDFTKLLKRADCQRADVLKYVATWQAKQKQSASTGGSDSDSGQSGQSATGSEGEDKGRGAANTPGGGTGLILPNGTPKALEYVGQLVAMLETSYGESFTSGAEFATLSKLHLRIEKLLNSAPADTRMAGRGILKSEADKLKQSQQSAN